MGLLVDADAFGAVTTPNDGDEVNMTGLDLAFQALNDRAFHLQQRTLGAISSAWVGLNQLGASVGSGSGTWTTGLILTQTGVGTANVSVPFQQPAIEGQVSAVRAWVKGTGHSALPAVMPELYFQYLTPSTGVLSTPESQVDLSASFGAFDTIHAITLSLAAPLVWVPGVTKLGAITIVGESGTDSQNGFQVYGMEMLVIP